MEKKSALCVCFFFLILYFLLLFFFSKPLKRSFIFPFKSLGFLTNLKVKCMLKYFAELVPKGKSQLFSFIEY